MALRMSYALRNFLAKDGSLRKALEDGVLRIYSGSQPASADAAIVGTLLVSITKNHASFTEGVRSTAKVAIVVAGGTPTTGQNSIITINGVAYTLAETTGHSLDAEVTALCDLINENPDVVAVPAIGAAITESAVILMSRRNGVTFTVARTVGTGMVLTITDNVIADSRGNGLQMATVAAGVLSKDAEIWSGVAGATGTAGWFRFQGNAADDDGVDVEATSLIRVDGNIAASGADLNMRTSIENGATITIDECDLTVPANI